jgi:nucleoside-diphosphate-sugar epimerase
MSTVLVTGGSGFIGGYCILQLLDAGHTVRTTVRNLKREPEVRATLHQAGAAPGDRLSFFAADLAEDAGWSEAVQGCEYVLHVASPFPPGVPKHEDELIVPARDGALRVLRAARDAGVKRVVMTSSFAAVGYGHPQRAIPFTEADWTDPTAGHMTAYVKSKAIAERAAWDFMAREGGSLELAVINPVAVLGPLLGADMAASIQLITRLMDGSMPGCPRISFGVVDVRDVADIHLRAMTDPAAAGQRFLAVAGETTSMLGIAKILKASLGEAAKKVPTRELPDWLLRVIAMFDSTVRQIVPELGKVKRVSNEKARRILGWTPRSNEEAIIATAESLLRLGLVKQKR